MLATIAEAFFLAILVLLASGSLLNLSTSSHWFIRGWDFPRIQIVLLSLIATLVIVGIGIVRGGPSAIPYAMPIAVTLCVGVAAWHSVRIAPYTMLAPKQARPARPDEIGSMEDSADSIRVVVSNVLMENRQHERWIGTITDVDPDVLIALEVDDRWAERLEPLRDVYPHRIEHPRDNYYGMLFYSKLPIEKHEIRFLVEDDIPSIDAWVRLPSGRSVRVIGVHPRPPEPIRDVHSTARDAELVLWGRELREESAPVIIGGDLNDVAWSRTTRLFLKTGQLLDPRRGRGFFNTFHADHWYMRFPLDHVFHSNHFTIRRLERLPNVGSDHFPMLIDLQCGGETQIDNELLDADHDDEREAEAILEVARKDRDIDSPAVREGRIPDDEATV